MLEEKKSPCVYYKTFSINIVDIKFIYIYIIYI